MSAHGPPAGPLWSLLAEDVKQRSWTVKEFVKMAHRMWCIKPAVKQSSRLGGHVSKGWPSTVITLLVFIWRIRQVKDKHEFCNPVRRHFAFIEGCVWHTVILEFRVSTRPFEPQTGGVWTPLHTSIRGISDPLRGLRRDSRLKVHQRSW